MIGERNGPIIHIPATLNPHQTHFADVWLDCTLSKENENKEDNG